MSSTAPSKFPFYLSGSIEMLPPVYSSYFEGMTQDMAKGAADDLKICYQVISIDDNYFCLTRDLKPDRINFIINDGKVTRAFYG